MPNTNTKDNLNKLLEKSKALCQSLKIVENDISYQTVFKLSIQNGFVYKGPDWNLELLELEDIIKEIELES